MNPLQDNNNMDSQSTENIQPGASSPPSTPNEKVSQIDKEREMAELLMTMDNYKAIVLPL